MTNEEAKSCIGTIEMLRRLAYNIHGVMDVIDADNCEKIIKVLSDIPKYKDAYGKGWVDGAKATYEHLKMCEEEQEPCDDAISRQAVLEYIEGSEAELGHSSENELVCQYIKELPPVKTELKTGHWILKKTFPTKLYDEYLNEYKCSECYREIRCTESQLVNYPYCHCGTKMVEPQESEE